MTQRPWGTTIQGGFGGGAAESYFLGTPRVIDPAKRCLVFAHGANGQASDMTHPLFPNLQAKVLTALAAGYVVFGADFGGQSPCGNDASLATVESWWTWIKALGICATDSFVGVGSSMGNLTLHRYAHEHPTQVAGLAGFIPFLDIENARTNDLLGLRALANTAWGLPVGSFIGGADQTPVPTRGRPLDYASSLTMPTALWYSTADVISTNVAAYAAARTGVTLHVTSSSLTHGDPAIGSDNAGFLSFVQSVA
jgi:alpha-beta hydrolase superfamily lysophospholipase